MKVENAETGAVGLAVAKRSFHGMLSVVVLVDGPNGRTEEVWDEVDTVPVRERGR